MTASDFLKDQCGAVAVDCVVLSAAIVGPGKSFSASVGKETTTMAITYFSRRA